MIRNVVIHISNEQPLLADLLSTPTSTDISLVCTNLRMMNGSRPVFVDNQHSVFVFPYGQIRFLEVPAGATDLVPGTSESDGSADRSNGSRGPSEPGVEAASAQAEADAEAEGELELDEDFLRRIREV